MQEGRRSGMRWRRPWTSTRASAAPYARSPPGPARLAAFRLAVRQALDDVGLRLADAGAVAVATVGPAGPRVRQPAVSSCQFGSAGAA